jgi:hypothetical protein
MLIVSEAQSLKENSLMLITDKNAYYIPSNLVIHGETYSRRNIIAFLNADAPKVHHIPTEYRIIYSGNNEISGEAVYSTEL